MIIQSILALLIIISPVAYANINCCPPGQAVLYKKDVCWEPLENVTTPLRVTCKETIRFVKYYAVNDEQQLVVEFQDGYKEKFEADSFCMANMTTIKDTQLNKTRSAAIVCIGSEETLIDDKILGYCMIVSVIFLAATAVIYTLLPELRDIQGKSIINFCISLAIGLGILVIMKLMEYSDMTFCAVRGFLAYFFLITAFFWTNAISIQVLLNTRRPSVFDYSWKEFKWYMLYAWGCPVVLTVCMAIVNFHPGNHQKPGIGLNHCWFFNKRQQWYYMYSIMSLLLAANIGIFIYTLLILWRSSFSSHHLRALRFKFVMTVRLIILMGLPWVFEMIGSLFPTHIIWTILDVFNTLQGILIFLLLIVFRRRVVKLMYRHGWLDCASSLIERHLAVKDDEEDVVQHTDVPLNETILGNN